MEGKALEMKTVADYQLLLNLIASEHVIVYRAANREAFEKDEGIDPDRHLRFAINCGDTFMYACSDFTGFDLEDTRELTEMHEKFPGMGLVAWCARDRNETPIKELLTEEYYAAYEYAGKFFAESYDYIVIVPASRVDAMRLYLGAIGYTVQPIIGEKSTRYAFYARLTDAQMVKMWRLAGCIYRYYGGTRIKSVKHEYFQDGDKNSVFTLNKQAAAVVGLDYNIRFRYHKPEEVTTDGASQSRD